MRPEKLRWQQRWRAGTRRLDTTRKELSGKNITSPCLLSSRQVDDVPPRAEAVKLDAQNSKTQPKSRDSLTRHCLNDGREKQRSLSEKRGKTPNAEEHQPSPEEAEEAPDEPAKPHSKERHPDEKIDPNPEIGDKPPEKSDLESTSESASASASAGVEEQEGEPGNRRH